VKSIFYLGLAARSLLILFVACSSQGEEATIPELTARGRVYYAVKVKKVTPQGILIQHKGGLAQVLFKDMSPEWRGKFGYDARAEAEYAEEREAVRRAQLDEQNRAKKSRENAESAASGKGADRAPHWSSEPPAMLKEVDLRSRFRSLGVGAKDQNRRQSCAVFSVVNALEFAYAERYHQPKEFSEEFIVWAVRHFDDPDAGFGEGFNLWTILQRLLQAGVAENAAFRDWVGQGRQSEMPPPRVLENALAYKDLRIRWIYPNFGHEAFFNQTVQALNAGKPVVVGLRWPHEKTITNSSLLSTQPPVGLHAVTLVGYRNPGANREDMRFIFKNSWGSSWGVGGHGFITHRYFMENVLQGFTLEYP